jgi:DNA mismatch endonuclease (patch repair protein)
MESSFVAFLKSRCEESFELNDRTIIGRPDIVFRQAKVCVFLDSDFWHGWQYPRWKHLLKTEFWRTKIHKNRERDKAVTRKLRRQGWTVIRFWEHDLREKTERAISAVTSMVFSKRGMSTTGSPLRNRASHQKSFHRPISPTPAITPNDHSRWPPRSAGFFVKGRRPGTRSRKNIHFLYCSPTELW